jgi:hypothetical protein
MLQLNAGTAMMEMPAPGITAMESAVFTSHRAAMMLVLLSGRSLQ